MLEQNEKRFYNDLSQVDKDSSFLAVWTGMTYCNDPKFSDRWAFANSVDPDLTASRGAVWSGSALFAIQSASFGLIA